MTNVSSLESSEMAVAKKIDPASAKSKTTKDVKKPIAKKQTLRGKGLKKKKEHLRYGIDCTIVSEDNIFDVSLGTKLIDLKN
jgi:large subunit ribosomal protein L22e